MHNNNLDKFSECLGKWKARSCAYGKTDFIEPLKAERVINCIKNISPYLNTRLEFPLITTHQ